MKLVRAAGVGARLLTLVLLGTLTVFAANEKHDVSKVSGQRLPTAVATAHALGDFDAIQKRRVIRVAVPYSRSLFFNDKGEQHGIAADTLRDFEQWLNLRKQQRSLRYRMSVVAIPTTRDRMLPMLREGAADLAVGNITITPARDALVDFSVPFSKNINEIVLTGPSAPPLTALNDLSGKSVHVRKSSSYYGSLLRLNAQLQGEGMRPVVIKAMPEALEDEDLMDMVQSGTIQTTVVDDWKAQLWAPMLPGLVLHPEMRVAENGNTGWAFRSNSPQLAELVNAYARESYQTATISQRRIALQKRLKQFRNPTADGDWERFEQYVHLFRRYADRYEFDHLMLVAQGYQESRLDQAARSSVGAVGIMQLMPQTGQALKVGDIHQVEPNVHAGIKYMRQLRDSYTSEADVDQTNKTLFAFAAYNAGPGRLAGLRTEAKKQGLDPKVWFNNVEVVASKRVGQESVNYVRNIYKYYVAYVLELETLEARRAARALVTPSN